MHHAAARRRQLRLRHVPGLRRSRDDHVAAGCADLAQRFPVGRRRVAAAGVLRAVLHLIEIRLLDADVFPVDVELFGDEHRQVRLHALADVRVLRHQRDDAVRGDRDERGRGQRWIGDRNLREYVHRFEVAGDHHAAAGDGGDAEEIAPRQGSGCHRAPPSFRAEDPVARAVPRDAAL